MSAELDYRKYLDPHVLARLGALDLRARTIVEGYFSGTHRSPFRGLSVEFADHRAYTQGDDIRHIDWKVFGRTNKYYIKEYEQETNLNLVLAVDGSASMSYGSEADGLTKHEYGTALAASLAYLALQQRDAVGVAVFADRIVRYIRPSNSAGHWRTLVHELSAHTGAARTDVPATLSDLAERLERRSLVVLVSDLFTDLDGLIRGLKHLKYRRHDIVVFQVMDHAEIAFPFRGPTRFEGLEASGALFADARGLRDRYLEEVERFTDRVRTECRKMTADFARFDTSEPLDAAISAYLATRAASIRRHGPRTTGAA